jgi:hypothetical protein
MSSNKALAFAVRGPSTMAVKTGKGNARAPKANTDTPALERQDSGSPSSSKLKHKASVESNKSGLSQIVPLERTNTGGATLGVKESDEEIEEEGKSGSEDGSGRSKRSSQRFVGSARSSHGSGRSGRSNQRSEQAEASKKPEAKPRQKKTEIKHQDPKAATKPKTKSKAAPLTKSALTSLGIHQAPSKKRKEKEKNKKKKVRYPNKIRIEVDIKRKALVRKGVYDDGTKPWEDRFGRPDQDLLELITKNKLYSKVKRHFWAYF